MQSVQDVLQIPADLLEEELAVDWTPILTLGGRLLVILVLAWFALWLLRVVLRRIEKSAEQGSDGTISADKQRIATIVSLVRSVGFIMIAVIMLFMVLTTVGVEIGPLLAGAGVVGLAISFGAQSLVRDVISGLFFLFENQFGVGDVIRIADVAGKVEKVTLRIVVMRDLHGTVHIVPNGEIKRISNLTRAFSRAVVDIGVAYRENVDRVMDVMREVGAEMHTDPDWAALFVEEPAVLGIEAFADSSVNIRMLATTVPLKQWDVARELRRRLKHRFDAEGIEIPYPHRTLFWGDADRDGGDRPENSLAPAS